MKNKLKKSDLSREVGKHCLLSEVYNKINVKNCSTGVEYSEYLEKH